MHEIFINYRTGDEENSAALIDQELSRRFGSDLIFRASKSIPLGEDYTLGLPTAVRKSEVLLAVIGSRWLTVVDDQGRNCLHNETDWLRKEILEAFEHAVRVIPILVGRTLPRLCSSDLPPELAMLADCQYYRLDHRSSEANLRTLGDDLVALVPSLVDNDQHREEPEQDTKDGQGSTTLRAANNAHQQIGGTNTVVNDPRGSVNTGSGHQFTGDGVNYVTGGNSRGIRQKFGSTHQQPDDKR